MKSRSRMIRGAILINLFVKHGTAHRPIRKTSDYKPLIPYGHATVHSYGACSASTLAIALRRPPPIVIGRYPRQPSDPWVRDRARPASSDRDREERSRPRGASE